MCAKGFHILKHALFTAINHVLCARAGSTFYLGRSSVQLHERSRLLAQYDHDTVNCFVSINVETLRFHLT